jgi:inhibitor of KinA
MNIRALPAGDAAVTFEFGDLIDPEISGDVLRVARQIETANFAGIMEVVPTFRSFTVYFDPGVARLEEMIDLVRHFEAAPPRLDKTSARLWSLPTCYDPRVAPDLLNIARDAGLSVDQLITLHQRQTYLVYMLGFLPGQPYMGHVVPELRLPRLKTPRNVAAGSIGIAMGMTSVYPRATPCGWHIVAKTPSPLWIDGEPLIEAGDHVEFRPIAFEEYRALLETPVAPLPRYAT